MSEQLSFLPAPPTPPVIDVAAIEAALEADFEAFWLRYPRRGNNPKATARVSYRRARKTATAEEILDGLARYEFSPDPRLRPMAATWLNQRRFECVPVDLSADPWGLDEFLASLPDDGALSALSYERDAIEQIMLATRWPETWRGSLDALNAWLRDGYTPTSIADVLQAVVAKKPGARSLGWFDGVVRVRATQLDTDSFGYR